MPGTSMKFLLNSIQNFLSNQSESTIIEIKDVVKDVAQDVVQDVEETKAGKQVERVPPVFRNKQSHRDAYDPVIVSIGPYYHGQKGYDHAESFKERSCEAFLSDCQKGKIFFLRMMKDNIKRIRDSYEKLDPKIGDGDLGSLIFKDACFFIYFVKNHVCKYSAEENKTNIFYQYFGPARLQFIMRDLLLVENQIPFWIIKLMMESTDGGLFIWKILLYQFLSSVVPGYVRNLETEITTLHFLGEYYQALKVQIPHEATNSKVVAINLPRQPQVECFPLSWFRVRTLEEKSSTYRYRSITNLKAKGIRFKVSESNVIRFDSFNLDGRLHLPKIVISTDFFVLFSNIIAYEMSASSNTEFSVSSWVNFMKLLIESPGDVKILREKGIMLNDMVGDEEVVKVIKDLDTFGLDNIEAFSNVRDRIEKHCRSKAKTWFAELINTYFESPWNFIALMAAILLVLLTCIQTYYARNPVN